MATPQFPYLGNQAIVSSGRVVIHSYDDYIFHFGKKGVSISTPGTFTMDVGDKTVIASNRINLGFNAVEPVLLGKSTTSQLSFLLDNLSQLCDGLSKLNAKNLEAALPAVVQQATVLKEVSLSVKNQLSTNCLSKNTFTK
jgi:hypothetical protein